MLKNLENKKESTVAEKQLIDCLFIKKKNCFFKTSFHSNYIELYSAIMAQLIIERREKNVYV